MKQKKLGVILLALLLVGMAMVPMVSAEENSSGVSPTQPLGISKTALITFDGLSTIGSQQVNEMKASNTLSSTVTKYETLEIDAGTLKTRLLSGKQVPVHLKGVPYFMDLHEETFYPSTETGVYTFNGRLVSADGQTFPESSVHLTMDDNGILGHLSLNSSETIYLDEVSDDYPRTPEQPIAYSSKDVTPHTIDLTNDLIVDLPSGETKPVAQLSADELAWLKTEQERTAPVNTASDRQYAVLDSMVDVNLLIATDNTMYTGYSNWIRRAQSVLDDANTAFGVNDIKIRLVPIYDDSQRMELSQNFDPASPFPVFAGIFNDMYLTSKNADIAMYLSGRPFTGSAVGLSRGFDSLIEKRQAVMSYESMPGYAANAQDRAFVFTHELGHLFDGAHENAANQVETYNRATTYTVNGVELHTTMWSATQQDPLIFSTNDGVHGDANHNNALRLKETKGAVSRYRYAP